MENLLFDKKLSFKNTVHFNFPETVHSLNETKHFKQVALKTCKYPPRTSIVLNTHIYCGVNSAWLSRSFSYIFTNACRVPKFTIFEFFIICTFMTFQTQVNNVRGFHDYIIE